MFRLTSVAAAAAFSIAVPMAASAATVPGGHLGAEIGVLKIDEPGSDSAAAIAFVEAGYAGPLAGALGYQARGSATVVDADGLDFEIYRAEGHLFARNDRGVLALFAGGAEVMDESAVGYGAEAGYFWKNVTLAGQFGRAEIDDAGLEITGGGAQLTAYPARNLSVTGRVQAGDIELDLGLMTLKDDYDGFGAEAEWRPSAGRWSVFGGVSRASFDVLMVDATTLFIGVRLNFGPGDVKTRDRVSEGLRGVEGFLDPLVR